MTRLAAFAAVSAASLLASGCAAVFPLVSNETAPAAEGQASVSAGDNGNTLVSLTVKHLAAPAKVMGGAEVYVVWALSSEEGASPQNLGALKIDDALTGSLDTLTPLKTFELFITPEPTPASTTVSGPKVLSARITRK